jgi:hypothetical protein
MRIRGDRLPWEKVYWVVPVKFDLPSPNMVTVWIAVTVTQEDGTTTTRVFLFNLV